MAATHLFLPYDDPKRIASPIRYTVCGKPASKVATTDRAALVTCRMCQKTHEHGLALYEQQREPI